MRDPHIPDAGHVHVFQLWTTFHRAPAGPEPAHTSFVVLTCHECRALQIFPMQNFALCTDEFKAQFWAVAAAAGWHEMESSQ